MIVSKPIYHQARVEIEALTPHGVHAGHGDTTHDVLLVRDANGLPYLPATGLAGVLRHLCREKYGEQLEQELFGYVKGEQGQASLVQLTAGVVHNQHNQPCEGLLNEPGHDAVLALLLQDKPLVRQRVRLNEMGSAAHTGKFDVTCVPAGVRYSFFIGYWSDESGREHFDRLLALLGSAGFRLGHGTRSGHGAFKVNQLQKASWDLTTVQGREGYLQRSRSRASSEGLADFILTESADNALKADLQLKAESGWRIGGGEQAFSDPDERGKVPDLVPQSEARILWQGDKAVVVLKQPVVPASAVKGALAHRFAYHYRCLTGQFLNSAANAVETDNQQLEGVKELFGFASDSDLSGAAGALVIDDIYLDQPVVARQTHNKIDQFTGGVISGALFEEEFFWQTPLSLSLNILWPERISAQSRKALKRTLEDLCEGFLPLGAGCSRGLGAFIAQQGVKWSDQGNWIEGYDSKESIE